MASSDATPFPIKNQAYRVTFPILDADGDLVAGATGLDSEISKDGGTFVDCTSETTQIATSSGMYFLDLTSAEMNADTVAIIVKTSTSGAKTTPIVMYPVEDADIPVNVKQVNGTAQTANDNGADINAILVDVTGINGAAMRGTDSAALASVYTVARAGYLDELAAANLPTDVAAIPTTMVGTDNAALASVVGALNNAAAAGEVTTADTLMQYLKQLINILIGDPGVVTFKAEAAPGNAISLSEVIRAIHADVTGLNGASGSAWVTATGFSTHDAAAVKSAIEAGGSLLALIKAVTDNLPNSGALSDIATDAARLTTARAAVLTDWINNGRLDLLLDAILVDTGTTLDGKITTVDTVVDAIKVKTDNLAFTSGNVHSHTKATDVGGDASAANQTTIINHLTDIKDGDASDWDNTTDSLADLRAKIDTITAGTPINVQTETTTIVTEQT